MYAATMEVENAPLEAALFSNIDETRTVKPVGYPQEDTSLQNAFVAKLNAKDGGKKIGPSIVLRVMAGDTVQIGARAFYKSTAPVDNKSATPEDMIASLVQAFAGSEASSDAHSTAQADRLTPFGNFNSNDYQRLKEKDVDENKVDKPRAYLNFVLFDDQFNLVDENSGVRQVRATPDELQALAVDKMPITKTGYLYVYTSNEAAQDVFFDNVILGLTEGPLLEETHYYPFGLTMAGISANALKGSKYPENRKRFQGQDFDNELGLDWYGFRYRNHDPQTGRFIQIDPLSDKYPYNSTYAFSENKVTSHVELEGLESIPFQYNGANTMAVANLFRSESKQISKEIILNTQKVENAANAKAAPLLPATVMAPELSIPYALTLLTGAPVLPSPQAMSTSLTASSLEAGVQTEGSSNTLFHYTSEIGYNGILESGELNASIGLKNARHGNGQYFTDIAPSSVGATSKSVLTTTQVQEGQISLGQLSSKLYGMPFKTGSLTHYIEVDVKGIQISNPKNNIFLNNSNTSLNLGGRIKSHGLTMGN
jgi:RHS repeat-associated protein